MHITRHHRIRFANIVMALTFTASTLPGQSGTPWLASSAGFGAAHIGNISVGGLGADIAGGLTLGHRMRIGARFEGVTSVDIGDQPGWSARTVLGIASYTFDSSFTVSSGLGRMMTHQKDSAISGRAAVCETGLELALPRGTGPAVRFFVGRTWPIASTRWKGTTYPFGSTAQFHAGLGVLFR